MRQTSPIMRNPDVLITSNMVAAAPLSRRSETGAGTACREPSHGLIHTPTTERPHVGSGKQRLQTTPSNEQAAEDVLRAFNTWAYKREQPSDLQLLQQTISGAIARAQPVTFVMYWGKGPRDRVDAPDIACLDYLSSLCHRVSAVYVPGATFTLIFTDRHAKLNGYTPHAMQRYFSAVEARAHQHGFSTCLLSDLTNAASWEMPSEPITEVPEELRQILCESAAKWYRGESSVEHGALEYYKSNMVEKQAVEFAFPGTIFASFSGSKLQSMFPNHLPIFYMYSLRRGFSIKPWFLSVDASSPDGSAHKRIA